MFQPELGEDLQLHAAHLRLQEYNNNMDTAAQPLCMWQEWSPDLMPTDTSST